MNKGLAFILLVCHINFSMFLPQIAERDVFDSFGRQQDDINSLFEYIDQVILGNDDDTPEDEDNDSGQNFGLVKISDYNYQQIAISVEPKHIHVEPKTFSTEIIAKLPSVSFEIITPPPEA